MIINSKILRNQQIISHKSWQKINHTIDISSKTVPKIVGISIVFNYLNENMTNCSFKLLIWSSFGTCELVVAMKGPSTILPTLEFWSLLMILWYVVPSLLESLHGQLMIL